MIAQNVVSLNEMVNYGRVVFGIRYGLGIYARILP